MNFTRQEMLLELAKASDAFWPDRMLLVEGEGDLSDGAEFLDTVGLSLAEAIEYGRIVPDADYCGDGERRGDVLYEIASGSLPVSTYHTWLAFADLGAYEPQWDDMDGLYEGMFDRAQARLILVAESAMSGLLAKHFDTPQD